MTGGAGVAERAGPVGLARVAVRPRPVCGARAGARAAEAVVARAVAAALARGARWPEVVGSAGVARGAVPRGRACVAHRSGPMRVALARPVAAHAVQAHAVRPARGAKTRAVGPVHERPRGAKGGKAVANVDDAAVGLAHALPHVPVPDPDRQLVAAAEEVAVHDGQGVHGIIAGLHDRAVAQRHVGPRHAVVAGGAGRDVDRSGGASSRRRERASGDEVVVEHGQSPHGQAAAIQVPEPTAQGGRRPRARGTVPLRDPADDRVAANNQQALVGGKRVDRPAAKAGLKDGRCIDRRDGSRHWVVLEQVGGHDRGVAGDRVLERAPDNEMAAVLDDGVAGNVHGRALKGQLPRLVGI